jgi:hypothetical protein
MRSTQRSDSAPTERTTSIALLGIIQAVFPPKRYFIIYHLNNMSFKQFASVLMLCVALYYTLRLSYNVHIGHSKVAPGTTVPNQT